MLNNPTPESLQLRSAADWYNTFKHLGENNDYEFMFSPRDMRRIADRFCELYEANIQKPLPNEHRREGVGCTELVEDLARWVYSSGNGKTIAIASALLLRCYQSLCSDPFATQPNYKEVAEKLAKALELCKADLQAEYEARYPKATREMYPSVFADYHRDMSAVYDAQKALTAYQALTTKETHD